MSKLRHRNDSLNGIQKTIRRKHSRMPKNRLSQNRLRQRSGFNTVQKVMSMFKPILFGLTPANPHFFCFTVCVRLDLQMRSSLNITGLSPSLQQLTATPFSFIQGRSPPKLKSWMVQYMETQAEVQKPSGILRSSTMNS